LKHSHKLNKSSHDIDNQFNNNANKHLLIPFSSKCRKEFVAKNKLDSYVNNTNKYRSVKYGRG